MQYRSNRIQKKLTFKYIHSSRYTVRLHSLQIEHCVPACEGSFFVLRVANMQADHPSKYIARCSRLIFIHFQNAL